jgi:asparagine synthase (glutamine-hydrolysing)
VGVSGLAGVEQVGTSTAPLGPTVERVIRSVVNEHLSYLDATSLRALAATVQEVEAAGVDGVLIEAGTALGGSAITMAAAKSPGRPLRLYDVFGMIPPPSERDGSDVHRRYAAIAAGQSKGIAGDTYYGYRDDLRGEVSRSFARHGFPVEDHDVELVAGRFEDTLVVDGPVALAHLDGDWYESTMTCLARIAPRLSPGGRIVVDDYDTWSGCRTAVDEYFADHPGFRFEHRGRLHVVRA